MKKITLFLVVIITIIGLVFNSCGDFFNQELTGTVRIQGNAKVGETLTANTSDLGGSGTISYQWKRGTTNIGNDSNTYIVVPADYGSTITVTVTRADHLNSKTSAATEQVGIVAVRQVSAGYEHTVVIKENGELWAWGNNENGQLGDGTIIERHSPVRIGTDTDWVSVFTGYNHTMAIKENGELWAWGKNENGKLGVITDEDKDILSPIKVGIATDWELLSAGSCHTMAIKKNGELWAWGLNSYGRLGDGSSYMQRQYPVQIGTDWKSVSAGENHTVAIKINGELYTWGNNWSGQLGDSTNVISRQSLEKIGTDTDWLSVSGGQFHTMAINEKGELWAWGDNKSGQLGDGTNTERRSPVKIGTDTNWASVYAGVGYTIAIKTNGELWEWGSNIITLLADNTNIPVQIGSDADWSSLSAGGTFAVATNANGELWTWGLNTHGQLGDGSTNSERNSLVRIIF